MTDLSFVAGCPWAGQQQVTIYAKTPRGAELCARIIVSVALAPPCRR